MNHRPTTHTEIAHDARKNYCKRKSGKDGNSENRPNQSLLVEPDLTKKTTTPACKPEKKYFTLLDFTEEKTMKFGRDKVSIEDKYKSQLLDNLII
jgi:hypothetical protein